MSARVILGVLGGAMLLGFAASGDATPADGIVPDKEVTPLLPVGAADRAKNGPSHLAFPPNDAGAADDPDTTIGPLANMATPPAPPPPPPR